MRVYLINNAPREIDIFPAHGTQKCNDLPSYETGTEDLIVLHGICWYTDEESDLDVLP